MSPPTTVSNDRIREHAERLAGGPVALRDLSMAFEESRAATAEVLVEGRPSTRRCSRTSPRRPSSVHINQFGFRPGVVGERFAEVLLAKAAEGVPVRLVVDRQGSDPEGGSQELYERLTAAGIEVCVVRATKPRVAGGALGAGGATALEPARARPHRPPQGGRRSTAASAGSAAPGSRTTSRTAASTTCSCGSRARSSRSCSSSSSRLPLARRPGARGRPRRPVPRARARASAIPAVVLHNAPGRYRPITDAIAAPARRCARDARRRQPVRHRPRDDPAHRAGRTARRPRAAVRAREREQLGLRGRAAVPPRARCSTPACGSSSTRRCSTRRRSCATARRCSPAPATSRRGA